MEDAKKQQETQIFSSHTAKFTIVTEDKKVFNWEFPPGISLMENYDKLTFLRNKIWEAIENQRKKEEEEKSKKEDPKKGKYDDLK